MATQNVTPAPTPFWNFEKKILTTNLYAICMPTTRICMINRMLQQNLGRGAAGETSQQPPIFKMYLGKKSLVVQIHTNCVQFEDIFFPKFLKPHLNFVIVCLG